jgi:D-apionolactonase
MLSKAVIHYGTETHPTAPLSLRAGNVTMSFDPDSAFLRQVRLGEHEVVRAIYGAVRDRNWDTVPARVMNLIPEIRTDSFCLTFEVECRQGEIDFFWRGLISGETDGTVTCQFDGEARSSFLRNRIGLCVLHPIVECAGRPCIVEHTSGVVEKGEFPRFTSPHQPFKDIRVIRHEAAPGVQSEVWFEGDTFEMEDQRNWTDASFKTYSTPLEEPFPVLVEKGTRIEQKVTIRFAGGPKDVRPNAGEGGAELSIASAPVLERPPLGLCVAGHGQELSAREIELLRGLRPGHLRVDLNLADADYPAALERAVREAGQLGAGLHLALFLTDDAEAELDGLLAELGKHEAGVSLWLVFHAREKATPDGLAALARKKLAAVQTNSPVAAGTNAYFAELNRNRPGPGSTALPCYSINPQVHAFDHLSLIENLEAQAVTVESTRQFADRPVVISPITLRPRFNPNATAAETGTNPQAELPVEVDPRQMSLFGAVWTLGSIVRLATTGKVHSLTCFETTGWRGVLERPTGSPLPEQFPSIPGGVFPLYHVLADLAGFDRVLAMRSSRPLQAEGVILFDANNSRRILVANLLSEPQVIRLNTGPGEFAVSYLDETNMEEALRQPEAFRAAAGSLKQPVHGQIELHLLPYALARLDGKQV